ncbi:MAG: hypothetical protein ACF8CQ_15520, partial [Rhodopirellula sp. JB044]|uniref:hypothetical protein n=1 Tax=Rhodopirellula sp. JB044 TaxID=3342844 RepID=UPI00370A32C0
MKLRTTSPPSSDNGIELDPTGIETCEPRLALSASMMGAWLAPLADPLSDPFEADPLQGQNEIAESFLP